MRAAGRRGGPRTLGLVLSGGGARGVFQVGAYERLLEDARFAEGPSVLSGTSAGGINAALVAAGKSPREMLQFWKDLADDPPVTASAAFFDGALRTLVRLSVEEATRWLLTSPPWRALLQRLPGNFRLRPGNLLALWVEYLLTARFDLVSRFLEGIREPFVVDTAKLRARLVDAFGGERVRNQGFRLALNAVDAHTGRVVRYVTAPAPVSRSQDYVVVEAITVDMVLASASIPLLFPPVQIGRHLLWDGGLLVNTPLAPAVALGAEEIVAVLVTEPPAANPAPFAHFGRAVERTVDSFLENAYNVDRKLLLERNRITRLRGAPYRDVALYEALRPVRDGCFNAGSYLYFERRVLSAMHDAGRRAASAWLAAGPRLDRLDEPASAAAAPGS